MDSRVNYHLQRIDTCEDCFHSIYQSWSDLRLVCGISASDPKDYMEVDQYGICDKFQIGAKLYNSNDQVVERAHDA